MANFLKTAKGKIISISLAVILVACGVGGYFIFRKRLKYDYRLGELAYNRVENAQYDPDIDKFIEINSAEGVDFEPYSVIEDEINLYSQESNVENYENKNMTLEEFSDLVDEYGKIENYAGAGKYGGYDIYEIKNEISYVVKNVPAFNQWFRLPIMREKQGYVSIPYYETWAYYLEFDEETSVLSITRVCWCTRSSYLDFDNKKVVEEHKNGKKFVQYEIMKTNYYYDSNGDEVVECYFYSVGVDNSKDGNTFNANEKDYYPFEYQYLKNVKDKSLIKYHITAASRYRCDTPALSDFDFAGDNYTMDIRGLNPYGVRREFLIINYDGYVDIDLTKIDQKFATLDNPTADGSISFDISSSNIKFMVDTVGLNNEEYQASTSAYDLMDKVSKHIIDNFELKNNWTKIYEDSVNEIILNDIEGPFYKQKLPFSYLRSTITINSRNLYNYNCDVKIVNPNVLETGVEYSLSLALKSESSIYVVATDYKSLTNNVKDANITSEIYSEFKDINIEEDGEYTLVIVLTKNVYGKDVIVFDTNEPVYLMRYMGLNIPDSVDGNGVMHSYSARGVGGKLVVTVSTKNA